MATYVERAVTEVIPEAEPAAATEKGDPRWEHIARLQTLSVQMERLELRVGAEGFDD